MISGWIFPFFFYFHFSNIFCADTNRFHPQEMPFYVCKFPISEYRQPGIYGASPKWKFNSNVFIGGFPYTIIGRQLNWCWITDESPSLFAGCSRRAKKKKEEEVRWKEETRFANVHQHKSAADCRRSTAVQHRVGTQSLHDCVPTDRREREGQRHSNWPTPPNRQFFIFFIFPFWTFVPLFYILLSASALKFQKERRQSFKTEKRKQKANKKKETGRWKIGEICSEKSGAEWMQRTQETVGPAHQVSKPLVWLSDFLCPAPYITS